MTEPATACLGQTSLSFEGQLDGWCWYPDRPMERAVVDVLVNGHAVRAFKAARLRTDLRDLGMGDGYSGFLLPMPSVAAGGARAVVEVRERRFGQIIGRILLGEDKGDPAMLARLDCEAATMSAVARRLDTLASDLSAPLAAPMKELGGTLLHLSRHPAGRAAQPRFPGLAACHDQMTTVPRLDLGWFAAPHVSVVVPVGSGSGIGALAAMLYEAAYALRPLGAEFILLDDGSEPLAALLPTRLKHLLLVRTAQAPNPGAGLNAAALSARAPLLAFAKPGRLSPAGLLEACQNAEAGTLYLDATTTAPSLVAAPGASSQLHGLQCLMARSIFTAIGGFDPTLQAAALWSDMLEKSASLGEQVVAWAAARPARPLRMSTSDG
jgi:hypothetical protein